MRRHTGNGQAGRRGPSFRVFLNADCERSGDRDGAGHGGEHRDREDRDSASERGTRRDSAPEGNAEDCTPVGIGWTLRVHHRNNRLWAYKRELAQRISCGHYARDGTPAGRISRGAHDFPRLGSVADITKESAQPTRTSRRDPGLCHGPLRGQDGHTDTEPYVGPHDLREWRVLYGGLSEKAEPS